MRVIIAGSRDILEPRYVDQAVDLSGFLVTEVVSGAARGVDRLGEEWAEENKIPFRRFPANWKTFGKSAGYKRNVIMAKHADALIAIWDGKSKGTMHMIDIAGDKGLPVYVFNVAGDDWRKNETSI